MKKIIYLIAVFFVNAASAQDIPAKDWYLKSVSKKNAGVDVYRSYDELLKDKKPAEIVVAVIDGGTDINHPDLVQNIWHNPGEIPFNGKDDDGNGYTDDSVGWNFIGGADGGMVEEDNLEITRLVRVYSKEFEDLDAEDVVGDSARMARYALYQELKSEVKMKKIIGASYYESLESLQKIAKQVKGKLGNDNPTKKQLKSYSASSESEKQIVKIFLSQMKKGKSFKDLESEIEEQAKHYKTEALFHYNVDFDPRKIVGDDYSNSRDKSYGNPNVVGADAGHGTHVAGIIAATRKNGIGIDGISNARIMVIRVVPNGDERDKDVANGIRYAVDNGAKIINMSFGKAYNWDKAVVNEAVEYAVSKNVLLVHAAGNDGKNTDIENNFPNDRLGGDKRAATWIEIGASTPEKCEQAANFSNYGKDNVDLFAPGYQIYSTIPENSYAYFNGTSMAAPVVSGVAALVWSYYPGLSAVQLKDILMKSSVINSKKVPLPGSSKTKVRFTELSQTGGVVNAYNALKMAESIVTGK